MSQHITLELSDQAFASLQRRAQAAGTSADRVVAELVERQFGAASGTEQRTPGRLERLFGSVDLGRPTGADNEAIDADLARSYGDDH